jgi:hypothetical protein
MSRTHHMKARMTQRAIDDEVVRLALEYGEQRDDGKVIFTRKHAESVALIGERLKRLSQKIAKSNGVVVVTNGQVEITTYRLSN